MQEEALRLLKELTEAHSVPGHEEEVREIFVREMDGCGEIAADRNGSVVCESEGDGPRVLLAGHMDEVGFLVQAVLPEGFLKFVPVGGWWPHTLLAQRVMVRTAEGRKVPGVIGSKPPHFLPESQKRQLMPIDQMFIDVGASSREEVEAMGIRIGDPVAPWVSFEPLAREGRYMAKAFDNRVGMAGAIQTGRSLAKAGHPNRLVVAGTVQEEAGLRGARTLARMARPDVAIILEGPPADDTPGFPKAESQGRLGGGVQIRAFDPSAIMNPRLVRLVEKTARAEGIRHQLTVRRSGGTDAGALHLSGMGVPCVVLGVPARYIHSHNAVIDIDDYLQMVFLAEAVVKRLDEEALAELVKFV